MNETYEPLESLIKAELQKLPPDCTREYPFKVQNGHEWVPAYSVYRYDNPAMEKERNHAFQKTFILPYFICKHCHAVSENYTDAPTERQYGDRIIKRAR